MSATPRIELVRQCVHTARCMSRMARVITPPTPELVTARREWMAKARIWRDHYERELRLNAEFLAANPAALSR